ncbi:hypothetical protein C1638_003365 [Chryseobacterium oncorhynchi]|uniref:Uncharacterized protein n=1 Tax=Chryseobacterium oncorhynchi TaxID=741074 RepID=A0A316X287_9FLAO|nr:hypothetical protein C1638_003365 [Chryseobacterium oncorhynchi]
MVGKVWAESLREVDTLLSVPPHLLIYRNETEATKLKEKYVGLIKNLDYIKILRILREDFISLYGQPTRKMVS